MTPNSTTIPARPRIPAAAGASAVRARQAPRIPGGTLDARIPPLPGADRLADIPARGHPGPARVRSRAQHRGDRHRAGHRPRPDHAPLRRARSASSAAGRRPCRARGQPAGRAGRHDRGRGGLRHRRRGLPGRRRAARARRRGRDRDDGTAPGGQRALLVLHLPRSRVLPAGGHAVRRHRSSGGARPAGRRRPRARRPGRARGYRRRGGRAGRARRCAARRGECVAQVARCATRLDRAGMHVAGPRLMAAVGQVAVLDAIGGIVPAGWFPPSTRPCSPSRCARCESATTPGRGWTPGSGARTCGCGPT